MYYVVQQSGVTSASSIARINKILRAKFQQSEFKSVGRDFMVFLDVEKDDLQFVQDKRAMENLCFSGFFRKDNSVKFMVLFNLIFTFISLIMVSKIGG